MLTDLADRMLQIGRLRQMRRRVRRSMPDDRVPLPKKVSPSGEVVFSHDVRFERSGQDFRIAVSKSAHRAGPYMVRFYIPAFHYWFARCEPNVRQIVVNCSDGDLPSAARFANSSINADVVPLPDAHFFSHRGYAEIDRSAQDAAESWSRRSNDIVWRGYPTGKGYFNTEPHLADHPGTVQRLRMAQATRDSEIDFRFVRSPDNPCWNAVAERAGLMAEHLPSTSWANRKFAIDIDGFTNAWSNLMTRLKLGCCVLKVGSEFGFRQWYYDRLKPFEHYVPVCADLSDLFEKVEWVRSHDNEAREIAIAGQELARAMTFETETAEAVRLITRHWQG